MKYIVKIMQLCERNQLTKTEFVINPQKLKWMFDDNEIMDGIPKIYEDKFWLDYMPQALKAKHPYAHNWSESAQAETIKILYNKITNKNLEDRTPDEQKRLISIFTDNIWERLDLGNDPHAIIGISTTPIAEEFVYYEHPFLGR